MPHLPRRDFVTTLPVLLAAGGCAAPPQAPAPTPAPTPRPWTDAPAYSIVRVEIRDGRAFGEYAAGHTPSVAAAGGRFVVAGALPQTIEGSWPARRMVIHEWPRPQAFLDWYGIGREEYRDYWRRTLPADFHFRPRKATQHFTPGEVIDLIGELVGTTSTSYSPVRRASGVTMPRFTADE